MGTVILQQLSGSYLAIWDLLLHLPLSWDAPSALPLMWQSLVSAMLDLDSLEFMVLVTLEPMVLVTLQPLLLSALLLLPLLMELNTTLLAPLFPMAQYLMLPQLPLPLTPLPLRHLESPPSTSPPQLSPSRCTLDRPAMCPDMPPGSTSQPPPIFPSLSQLSSGDPTLSTPPLSGPRLKSTMSRIPSSLSARLMPLMMLPSTPRRLSRSQPPSMLMPLTMSHTQSLSRERPSSRSPLPPLS